MPEPTPSSREAFSGPDSSDRRVIMRWPVHSNALCNRPLWREDSAIWLATVRDLSSEGAGLVISRGLCEGTVVELTLQSPAKDFSRKVLATVMHVTALEGGGWAIGCAFLDPLTDRELAALL